MSIGPPWERQSNDTQKSWAAFCLYRDLGGDRSILKAYLAHIRRMGGETTAKKAPRTWENWASNRHWVQRVAAYDSHLDVLERAKYEKEKLKARVERHQLIRLAKSKLAEMLDHLNTDEPKAGEVVNMARLVLQEERAEFDDEPAQRHEHSGPAGEPIPVSVIDEALRKIYGEKEENEQ